jgi:iron complex transport system substrate-binding protein
LTKAGQEFREVVERLGAWGQRHAGQQFAPSNLDPSLLMWAMHRRADVSHLPKPRVVLRFEFRGVPARFMQLRTAWLVLEKTGGDVCMRDPGFEVDVVVHADVATLAKVHTGHLDLTVALRAGGLKFEGPRPLVQALPVWLRSPTSSSPRTPADGPGSGGPMYGKTGVDFPQRVVCLTAETAEIAFTLGAGDRVVGVPGTARRPEAVREKARVGGFTTFRTDKILALEPDLVLAFSDLQRDVVSELIAAGITVLCTNQRSFDDVLRAILLIGGALGLEPAARGVVDDVRDEVKQIREYSANWPDHPRVYFEEWMDPMIAGIRWVSELIEIAGGQDVFAELREHGGAKDRIVTADEVARRDPQIILASWCGKPVDTAAILARPGWRRVSAVAAGQVHEIPGEDVLSPGPSLVHGLRRIHEIIQAFQVGR